MTKRALISVSDKAGIVEFAQELKKTRLGHHLTLMIHMISLIQNWSQCLLKTASNGGIGCGHW